MQKEIEALLARYRDRYLPTDLMTSKVVKQITIEPTSIKVVIVLGYPVSGIKNEMADALKTLLAPVAAGRHIDIQISTQIAAHTGTQGMPALPNVKNIIAVASGKGGVGKSTVAINLALALHQEGAQIGILDADIYGPSQPTMLGTQGQKPVLEDGKLLPVIAHGIQSMSIGYLVDKSAPLVWRGPMIGKAMQQMLHDTNWAPLDYLIVDLPPGTGDIQLTLCQKIPVSGAVIVTTPQDMALLDVRRACEMFQKLNVPILGVVENMSTYHCPACGHEEHVFGEGGAMKLMEEFKLTLLGQLPLASRIREMTDSGQPPVVSEPSGAYAKAFYDVARAAAVALTYLPKDFSSRFPPIVVKQDK